MNERAKRTLYFAVYYAVSTMLPKDTLNPVAGEQAASLKIATLITQKSSHNLQATLPRSQPNPWPTRALRSLLPFCSSPA
jgi:hypothetical protein